jgi:hypothetical protein
LGLAPTWCYCAWSGIPLNLRGGVTPGSVVLRFLVPIYSLFWVFAVNIQLGDAINMLLSRIGDRRRAPRTLPIIAVIIYFVPLLMLLSEEAKGYAFLVQIADHALWLIYMFKCDALRRAVAGVRYDYD